MTPIISDVPVREEEDDDEEEGREERSGGCILRVWGLCDRRRRGRGELIVSFLRQNNSSGAKFLAAARRLRETRRNSTLCTVHSVV